MDKKSLTKMTKFANKQAEKALRAANKEIKHIPVLNSTCPDDGKNDHAERVIVYSLIMLLTAIVIAYNIFINK